MAKKTFKAGPSQPDAGGIDEKIFPRIQITKEVNDTGCVSLSFPLPFKWTSSKERCNEYIAQLGQAAFEVFKRHGKEHLLDRLPLPTGSTTYVFVEVGRIEPGWDDDLMAATTALLTCSYPLAMGYKESELREWSAFSSGMQLGWLYAYLHASTPQRRLLVAKGAAHKRAHLVRVKTIKEQKEAEHRRYAKLMDEHFARFPHQRRMTAAKAVKEANELKVEPVTIKRAHERYGDLEPGDGRKSKRHSD